jgi:hypothetical protein
MNIIDIVLKNGKVDEVFFDREAAEDHVKNLNRKWNITEIIEKEVKGI